MDEKNVPNRHFSGSRDDTGAPNASVRASSARRKIQRVYHVPDLRRLMILYGLISLFFMVIIGRLWFLQIVQGREFSEQSNMQRTRTIRRIAPRGPIIDAKGRRIATSRPVYVVSVLPDELKKNPQVLPQLAAILNTSVEDITALITQNNKTPYDPVPIASDIDMVLLTKLEEQSHDLPGVLITQDPIRYYLDNGVCTHAIGIARPISSSQLDQLRDQGYRGGDIIGKEGIEAVYESDLRGRNGGQQVEVDVKGRIRRVLDEEKPVTGHTLKLAIDLDLQKTAYNGLMEAFQQGCPGSAVALDPNTGAVLAFVSVPSYDLNGFGKNYNKLNGDRKYRPLVCRASSSVYANGSTFKLITAAAGLNSGTISPSDVLSCPGYFYMGRWRFNCDKRSGHGGLSMRAAIAKSCDVYFYKLGQRVGIEQLAATARTFGLGQQTGIDLPSSVDSAGVVPSPEWKRRRYKLPQNQVWNPGDLINMSIGQGYVGVTPLQLARYTAAIANGGDLLRPQIVTEISDTSSHKVLHHMKREVQGHLGITEAQRQVIVDGMQEAMVHGTAAAVAIPGINAAGKTGTAQTGRHLDNSVFVCFAPVDHPKIAIAVLVEGGGFGAQTAAPIARRMLGRFFGKNVENRPLGPKKVRASRD